MVESEYDAKDYLANLRNNIDSGITDIAELFRKSLEFYRAADPNDDWFCDCQDDMEEIFDAWGQLFGKNYYSLSEADQTRWMTIREHSFFQKENFDKFQHFMAGARIEAYGDIALAQTLGFSNEIWDIFKRLWGQMTGTLKPHQIGFDYEDFIWTQEGAFFSDKFDTWFDVDCRDFVDQFINHKTSLYNYFPKLKGQQHAR